MAAIFVSILLSIICLLLLVLFLSRADGRPAETSAGKLNEDSIAGLSSTCIPDLDSLLGHGDYLILRATPELRPISDRFRRERRRIVLLWLEELRHDVSTLWKFRRFLVRDGLPVAFREEVTIASAAVIALLYLRIVRTAVFILGPFATFHALRQAKALVEDLSILGGAVLSRVPASRKAELVERWAQHIRTLRAA